MEPTIDKTVIGIHATVRRLWFMLVIMMLSLGYRPVSAATLSVVIEGVEAPLRNNIREYLSIVRYQGESLSESRARQLHRAAPQEIRTALRPFGYYRPEIKATLAIDDDTWTARYRVQAGSPLPVTRTDITLTGAGQDDPALQQTKAGFPLKPGDRLDHRDYRNGKGRMLSRALERGYLDAHYRHARMVVDLKAYEAHIELLLDTGPRYRFGEVRLEQNVLRESFLRRFIPFQPGDAYNTQALLTLQYRFDDSGYFQRVEVQPMIDQAEDLRVPVKVTLVPRKPQKATIGVGYGTDTGPRLLLGYQHRLVNRHGHRFDSELRLSAISSTLAAKYQIPIDNPATDRIELSAGMQDQTIEDRDSVSQTLGIARVNAFGKWQRTQRLRLLRERFDIEGEPTETSVLLMPGLRYLWASADDPVVPRWGLRWYADIEGGHESVVSDVSFAQLHTEAKGALGLWSGGRLLLRAEGGATAVSDFDELPLSQRFFAGGDFSVRGYAYQSLGPENAEGEVIGGQYLLTSSVELEQRIYGNWAAALFYDAGNAFADAEGSLKQGAGVGLRWRTPIGPLRLDIARTVGEPEADYRLHLTVGPDL